MNEWDLNQLKKFKMTKNSVLVDDEICLPTVENIVLTVDYQCEIPLKYVTGSTPSSFKKIRFAAATNKFHSYGEYSSPPTMQVFGTGKCVVMGSSSYETSILYIQYFRIFLRNIGLNPVIGKMLLRNRVYRGKLGNYLNLKPFIQEDSIGCVVHTKSFPGVYHYAKAPNTNKTISFLLFNTGSFIVMGLVDTTESEIVRAFNYILPLLKKHRVAGKITNSHIQSRIIKLRGVLKNIDINSLSDDNLVHLTKSVLGGSNIDMNNMILKNINKKNTKKQKIKK